jgi:hypothetical protein
MWCLVTASAEVAAAVAAAVLLLWLLQAYLVLGAVHECNVACAQNHLGIWVQVQQQRILAAGWNPKHTARVQAAGAEGLVKLL